MVTTAAHKEAANAHRVLLMVAELHVRGYQRLRILPHQYAMGHWRCVVVPATAFLRTNGARAVENIYDIGAAYSSGHGSAPFQWTVARTSTPSGLARRFIERFHVIAEAGRGADWPYAGWYGWMLHLTYPDLLPCAFTEWTADLDHGIPTMMADGSPKEREVRIPIPPPGEGPD